jgi:GT2 family glycosyltransferase
MALPGVTIVIPTRNRCELLRRCLSRLAPYVDAHPECSIIVSDDGDASQTREELAGELASVQIVQGPGRGPSANRNCGAAHATEELLIFLDDDCIPDQNLISVYREAAMENTDIGVFEGRISAVGRPSSFADVAPINETGGKLWSCNFAIRRELFVRINGFDDRYPFPAMEDIDLYWRVKRHSEILFLPDARVWHAFEMRLGWKIVKHHALSLLLYLHLHGLKETERGPIFFLKSAARLLMHGGIRQLTGRAAKYPRQQVFMVYVNLQFAIITAFWRFHVHLARLFFPSCCQSCRSIQSHLSGNP